ncbi:Glycosyl hydrolases family 28 [Musa troglodytarum]|uniref:Glycosyl hydrolases family 28 n=1 Tax=Musa troglodytarum TaxID=320322 RepID=A0A9E7EI47_9LILI|nr:Glycosyl hydrolases family 28 [Musa troglodytarum]URD77423.1 Glycosyl hydrolases family 28 [Musa troglodytarum]
MRILSWVVQNNCNSGQEKKRFDAGSSSISRASIPDVGKELGDRLHTLLAIGTLGDTYPKEEPQRHEPHLDISEDLPGFTVEEAKELQKELAKLLARKQKSSAHGSEIAEDDRANTFLSRSLLENSEGVNHGDRSPDTRITLRKLKDALSCSYTAIKKESLSFLLKRMFVCGRGFAQTPSFEGGSIADPSVEKILKAILTKKICPQSAAPTLMTKRSSDNKSMEQVQAGKWILFLRSRKKHLFVSVEAFR